MSKLTLAADRLSLRPLLAACLLGLFGLVVQSLALADDQLADNGVPSGRQAVWQWQGDCEPMAAACTVWFNHFSPAQHLQATLDGRQVPLESAALASLPQSTAQAILIQVANDGDEVSATLQTLLRSALAQRRAVQRLGLFLGQQNLRVLASLAAENTIKLTEALPHITGGSSPSTALGNLTQVIGMLGGVDAPRKVLTWITDHPALSADEVALLREELAADNIRLMILAIPTDAAAVADAGAPTIWPNDEVAQAYLTATTAEDAGVLVAQVTDNGFQLTVPEAHRCGEGSLVWQADFQETVLHNAETISQHTNVTAPPCPDTAENTGLQEAPDALDTNTDQDSSSPEQASDTDSTVGDEASTDSEDIATPEPDSTSPAQQSDATEQGPSENLLDNTSLVILGAMAILLLILLGLVLAVASNRKKTPPTLTGVKPPHQTVERQFVPAAPQPDDSAPARVVTPGAQVYAELTLADTTPAQRYPLSAPSVSIGRSQNNLIVLSDDTVSAFHAVITRQRSGEMALADLKSSNGTKVNGVPQTNCALHDGDMIEFGECRLILALR